ncbi:MAG: hypothetical protein ABJH05_16155 [Fulvivirga sp.]
MKITLIILSSIFLLACSSKSNEDKTSVANHDNQETSCLADIAVDNSLENMISMTDVAALINTSSDLITYEESKSSSSKYSTIQFKWQPEEERLMRIVVKAGDREIVSENPVKNQVNVGNLEVLKADDPGKYFKRTYGPQSDEEKAKAKERVDRASETSDEVDKQSAETIKKMVDARNVNVVENIGDQAYWDTNAVSGVEYLNLRVLHKNVMFKVTTDVSAKTEEDLELAKEVAKVVIANCK